MSKRELKHIENDIYQCLKTNQFVKRNSSNNLYQWYSFPNCKVKELCGVYYIYDKLHNKYYIGSSTDIISRVNTHRSNFKNNSDKSVMYLANLCHGTKFIEFGILELCNKKDLSTLERYYIRLADSVNNGWNKTYNTSDAWLRNRKWSDNHFYNDKKIGYII